METTNLNIRIDKEIKDQAEKIFNELGPVSYTHLDVYKRQVLGYTMECLLPDTERTIHTQDDFFSFVQEGNVLLLHLHPEGIPWYIQAPPHCSHQYHFPVSI